MRVAITGATGLIGSHCVAVAMASGHSVRMLVRDPSKAQRTLGVHGLSAHDVDVVSADLSDHSSLRTGLKGVDAVIHCAAVFSLNPLHGSSMLKTNPSSTKVIMEESANLGIDPVVYVSTSGVFMPVSGLPIGPNSELSTGCGPYTKSKIMAEEIAREYQATGAPVVCVYPGGVIGPKDPNPSLSESMALVTTILKRDIILMPKDALISLVDVRDVAAVCVGSLEPGRGARRYHIWGAPVPLARIVDVVNHVANRQIRLYSLPLFALDLCGLMAETFTRVTRLPLPLCRESAQLVTQNVRNGGPPSIDESTASKDFGYPAHNLEQSLRDTFNWLGQAGHLDTGDPKS